MNNNSHIIKRHEEGQKHKMLMENELRMAKRTKYLGNKQAQKFAGQLDAIEKAAQMAYQKDLAAGRANQSGPTNFEPLPSVEMSNRSKSPLWYYLDQQGCSHGPYVEELMRQ